MRAALPLALALVSGCATVDVYQYQARALPPGTAPQVALRQAVGQLEAVSFGQRIAPVRSRVTRAVVDGEPGALTIWADGRATPISYLYRELPHYVRAVTDDSRDWTVWIDRGPSANDLGLHFRSAQSARLFLDAANALATGPVRIAPLPAAAPPAFLPPPPGWVPALPQAVPPPPVYGPEPLDPYAMR